MGELSPAANDRTPPTGTLKVAGGKAATSILVVELDLVAGDGVSGMGKGAQMLFSNNGAIWSEPQPFASHRADWDLSGHGGNTEAGLKVVYARVSDAAGNWSQVLVAAVEYRTDAGDGPPGK